MDRQTLFFAVLGVAIVNGIFSPLLNIAIPITAVLLPELFPKTVEWVLFFSSIFVASATLLFSGVPAALYERLVDPDPASTVALWIWLGAAIVMAVPAFATLARI